MTKIFHITSEEEWKRAQQRGFYTTPSLDNEGFIHCSTYDQVIEVANHLFHGRKDLCLLIIEETRVEAAVRYEDPGNGKYYPHIYGPLNVSAVKGSVELMPDSSGKFSLPDFVELT